eukprot:jgi/Botrbrau1/15215/Bobra.0149s0070.1
MLAQARHSVTSDLRSMHISAAEAPTLKEQLLACRADLEDFNRTLLKEFDSQRELLDPNTPFKGVLFYLSRVVRQGGKLEEHVAVIHRALRALHRPQRKRSFAWVKERAASEPPERPASERNPIRAANVLVMSYYESIRRMQNDLVDAIKRHCATINRDQDVELACFQQEMMQDTMEVQTLQTHAKEIWRSCGSLQLVLMLSDEKLEFDFLEDFPGLLKMLYQHLACMGHIVGA